MSGHVQPIKLKRAYDKPEPSDGKRILVDRLWPRGVRKDDANLYSWARELAPSNALRKWFGHDPERWQTFRQRYKAELEDQIDEIERLRSLCESETVTLVYAARDEAHNNAVVLKEVLSRKQP